MFKTFSSGGVDQRGGRQITDVKVLEKYLVPEWLDRIETIAQE